MSHKIEKHRGFTQWRSQEGGGKGPRPLPILQKKT